MEERRFFVRTGVVAALAVSMFLLFVVLLYREQILIGVDEQSTAAIYTATSTETVTAVRGTITASDGTVLVDNSFGYQVTLNASEMGDTEAQVATILRLMTLCQQADIAWNENEMPVTQTQPYEFTSPDAVYSYLDEDTGEEQSTRLGRMCEAMGWNQTDSAAELLNEMRTTYGIETMNEGTARSLLGILYSCALRSNEILWTDYVFIDDVEIDFISVVKEEQLPGVEITATSSRTIESDFAAHLIGRVGYITAENWTEGENYKAQGYDMDDLVGLSGIEYAFEEYLKGTDGTRTITTDAEGNVIGEEDTVSAQAGSTVAVTLVPELQIAAEEALASYVPKLNEGEGGGAAVVIDVNSGAVLACASWPTYDAATLSYDESLSDLSPLFNRALQGTYSPGSTYKMVTATAGLETGVITPSTEIEDTGVMDYYDTQFRCWLYRETGQTHGYETLSDALRDSCNIYFYEVGIEVGIDTLTDFARQFGLGVSSGIELTESLGVNAGPEYSESVGATWYGGNLLSAAIGQSDNLFTPLQIANYIATLVNGGTRYSAHLLKSVTDASGKVTEYQPQVLNTVELSSGNLAAIKRGMLEVVENTAAVSEAFARLNAAGIQVGAKTGSAQVSAQENANGLFVCFAPYDDPQVAVCVAVEKGGSGAATSVIAANILESYFSDELQAADEAAAAAAVIDEPTAVG